MVWKVVSQHRRPYRAAHFHIVVHQLFLRGLDVVGRHHHQHLHPDQFGLLRQRDGVARRDAAHIAVHGHTPRDGLPAEAQRHGALLHIERVEFALRPGDEQPMHAARNQGIDHRLPGAAIDPLILAERRHQRGHYSMERTVRHFPMVTIRGDVFRGQAPAISKAGRVIL